MRGRTEDKRLIHEVRKAVAWYTKGLPGSADLRDQSQAPREPDALVAATVDYFAALGRGRPRLRVALTATAGSLVVGEAEAPASSGTELGPVAKAAVA